MQRLGISGSCGLKFALFRYRKNSCCREATRVRLTQSPKRRASETELQDSRFAAGVLTPISLDKEDQGLHDRYQGVDTSTGLTV
jgi:hypothetical protein